MKVDRIPGTALKRVTLTPFAAQRLGIATARARAAGAHGVSVPYASVLYDATGETYAYANPEPLVFNRVKLVVDTVQGDLAVLSDGPAAGTKVVTAGATELFGAEFEVGGE